MKYSLSNRKQFATLSLAVLALGLFVTGTAPGAHADALYNFTLDGCSGGCGPQTSFGTINLHSVNAQTVQITVSLLNGNQFLTTGTHTGFSFNIQGGAATVGTLPTGWADAGGPVTQPGFGVFSNGIDCTNGNSNKKERLRGIRSVGRHPPVRCKQSKRLDPIRFCRKHEEELVRRGHSFRNNWKHGSGGGDGQCFVRARTADACFVGHRCTWFCRRPSAEADRVTTDRFQVSSLR